MGDGDPALGRERLRREPLAHVGAPVDGEAQLLALIQKEFRWKSVDFQMAMTGLPRELQEIRFTSAGRSRLRACAAA